MNKKKKKIGLYDISLTCFHSFLSLIMYSKNGIKHLKNLYFDDIFTSFEPSL